MSRLEVHKELSVVPFLAKIHVICGRFLQPAEVPSEACGGTKGVIAATRVQLQADALWLIGSRATAGGVFVCDCMYPHLSLQENRSRVDSAPTQSFCQYRTHVEAVQQCVSGTLELIAWHHWCQALLGSSKWLSEICDSGCQHVWHCASSWITPGLLISVQATVNTVVNNCLAWNCFVTKNVAVTTPTKPINQPKLLSLCLPLWWLFAGMHASANASLLFIDSLFGHIPSLSNPAHPVRHCKSNLFDSCT